MRYFLIAFVLGTSGIHAEECFRITNKLDAEGNPLFSRQLELLCTNESAEEVASDEGIQVKWTYRIDLKMKSIGKPERLIASFYFDNLQRDRCSDCNFDRFTIANPSNSTFADFKVIFNGKIFTKQDEDTGEIVRTGEAGTIQIGSNLYYYQAIE